MIRVLLTSLIFFIFSCNPSQKEKIENKILNLAEQLIEINGIYESNNEIYEKYFSFKEPEFKSVESIFYKTLNIIEEIETLIYSNKVDVEYLKILDMGLIFAEGYGSYLTQKNYDNVWDQEYQIFFNDYIYLMSKVDEMYKYSDRSERYQDAFLFYSNNIINELIKQETKDKNNKGKLLSERYEKVLSIYDNKSIQIEIENEFIDYFGFISGYLNHSRREFVTKFNLNQIAELYNMISRVVIDEINNGKNVSLMPGSSTIVPLSEINDYNKIQIIYIIGFILNSYASDIYSSSSYMKESLALSDRAIDYLNKIDFENIVNIYENEDFQQLYNTTISLNGSINRLFHFSILQNSDFLANGSNKIIFRDKLSGYMGNIKVLEEFDKYNKHYIENYLDNKNLELYKNSKQFLKNNIATIIKSKNYIASNYPVNNHKFIPELNNDSLLSFSLYNRTQYPFDKNKVKDVYYWLNKIDEYVQNNEVKSQIANSNNDIKTLEEIGNGYYQLGKEAFIDISKNILIEDLYKNPELFIDDFKFLKEMVIRGVSNIIYEDIYKDVIDFSYNDYYLLEIATLDLLSELFNSNYVDKNLFEYLNNNIERSYTNNKYVLQNSFNENIYNYVYTVVTEGRYMEDIALYTITNSNFSSESFEVKKYGSYDEFHPLVSANNLEDLSNKFDTIRSLVNFNNSNLNNLQKELYDYIFKPIEDTLNENAAFTVFVLDSKLQNLPIEIFVDKDNNYVFDKFNIIRTHSLKDFIDSSKRFFSNNSAQNDKDVKILAVGNINYSNNNYNSISKRNNINNLPWTKIELEDIKKTFKNTYSLSGNRATETNFKKLNLKNYNSIHFAAHGLSFYNNYEKTSILLGRDSKNDGMLTYEEIKKLNLSDIDFMFLSACDTNIARPIKNISYPSLPIMLKQSGVNSIISTLWSIDDKASALFVNIFYKNYLKTPLPSFALNVTRKEFIKKYPEYSHPYYWAAFVNYGL